MAAQPTIGLAFLARGLHPQWQEAFTRFSETYRQNPAGIDHRLYVVFKGYRDDAHLREGERFFAQLPHVPIHTDDDHFDLGTYNNVARTMPEDLVCFLNTKTEILCDGWLRKLADHLNAPGVGLVGNTGSFYSHSRGMPAFPAFPNVHIRTNAFLIRRQQFCAIAEEFDLRTKYDNWMLESGPHSLSLRVLRAGQKLLVVGRDGRTYAPAQWPASGTYRCGDNGNALIADDDFRTFMQADPSTRVKLTAEVWGPYVDPVRAGEIDTHLSKLDAAPAFNRALPLESDHVSRNDPCPCGSGKRFKHCHGLLKQNLQRFFERPGKPRGP